MDLQAEKIAYIFGLPITNSFLSGLIVSVFLVVIAYIFSRNVKLVPGKFQNFIEALIEFMYNTAKETVGDEAKARKFFPLVATFFLFIIFSNWFGLLPFVGSIGFFDSFSGGAIHFTPLLRPFNTDLNATLALGIISAVATQYFAIKYLGILKHLNHYFSLNPLKLFVGILELVGEVTKVVSLSLRLYGNIIAGDSVISTFTALAGPIAALPFMGLEVIVGFVQAAVFSMLTLAFMSVLTQHEEV